MSRKPLEVTQSQISYHRPLGLRVGIGTFGVDFVVPITRRQASHWQQFHYCSRCERVFNPVSGRYAATGAVYGILRQDMQDGASRL